MGYIESDPVESGGKSTGHPACQIRPGVAQGIGLRKIQSLPLPGIRLYLYSCLFVLLKSGFVLMGCITSNSRLSRTAPFCLLSSHHDVK